MGNKEAVPFSLTIYSSIIHDTADDTQRYIPRFVNEAPISTEHQVTHGTKKVHTKRGLSTTYQPLEVSVI